MYYDIQFSGFFLGFLSVREWVSDSCALSCETSCVSPSACLSLPNSGVIVVV